MKGVVEVMKEATGVLMLEERERQYCVEADEEVVRVKAVVEVQKEATDAGMEEERERQLCVEAKKEVARVKTVMEQRVRLHFA